MTERLTFAEASKRMGLSAAHLRRQAIAGKLRAEREGPPGPRGIWYVTPEALADYLREYAGKPGPRPSPLLDSSQECRKAECQ